MNKSQFFIQIFNVISFLAGKNNAKRLLFYFFYRKYYQRNDLLFIHIPKAAGTSIAKALYGKRVGHFTALEIKEFLGSELFTKRKKFTVVRNPYDRLLSAYTYAIQGGTQEGAVNNPSLYKSDVFRSFKSFVTEWLVNQDMNKVELIFRPQHLFVYEGGRCLVDFIAKIEELDILEDWLSNQTGKSMKLAHSNKSNRSIEENNLDTETVNLVRQLYRSDFEKFKYSSQWQ
jgi:hypothetical protein